MPIQVENFYIRVKNQVGRLLRIIMQMRKRSFSIQ